MNSLDQRTRPAKPRDELASFLLSLETSSIGFGVCVRTDAARIYSMFERERNEWILRKRSREGRRHG